MSSATLNTSNQEVGGGLTAGVLFMTALVFGLAISFIGVLEWSSGGSFTDPAREIFEPILNGPQQVIQPYQCKSLNYRTDEWYLEGPPSPRDWIWGAKLVLVGGWYLFGGIIAIMLVVSIMASIRRPGFWAKADNVIGSSLIIWLLYGGFLAMIAMLLTSRQFSQCP